MSDPRYAAEFTVDISDLATEADIDEIRDAIETALAAWDPTVTVVPREYPPA